MAVEGSSEPNLLSCSGLGDDGRVTLQQHPTFEENQGRSDVRKRALAFDCSKSSHPSTKKSKLSSCDDEVDDDDDDDDDIEECTMEQRLKSLERDIDECAIVQKMKVNRLRKINEVYKKMQKKIQDCVCDLVSKETLCCSIEDLIRERELQLKTKEEELDAIKKLIDGKARELRSERKKLDKVISTKTVQTKECESMNNQLQARITEFESIKMKLDGRVHEFNLKEEEFRRRVKEAELKFGGQAKDLESERTTLEGQVKEFELKKEKFESQVKEHELKERREKQSNKEENEIDEPESLDNGNLLAKTSDPSKVVLDIIQQPIVPQFKDENDALIIDRSQIFLLEQLLRISPYIKPHVRGEAMKLALKLKGNMRTSSKNSLEVLGFLLLLSIYGLVPFFDEEEVLKLFEFSDKCSDFVQNLVKKQQHIEAVRFICAFKLVDRNQPVDLLWEYTQNAKLISESSYQNATSLEIQDARDQEIATLTNVLLCISDNNLESERLLIEIEGRFLELSRRRDGSVCTSTLAILQMCNNLRKRNLGLECGGRIEPSESRSAAAVSNGEDQQEQQQQQQQLSSEPSPLSRPQSSDLNHTAEDGALGGEPKNKLDLKSTDEGDSENVNEEVGREAYGVGENEEKSSGPHCPVMPDAEDCVSYMKTGSCKFGSSCRFNHSIRRRQAVMEKAGEPTEICRHYYRYGVCKFGNYCRYIHTRGNSFDGINGSERNMNNPAMEMNVRQNQMLVEEEFPQRPSEPVCWNFLKTGSCKFKSDCKFHHPRLPPCNLSDEGLPPRPDQNVCSHYSCKFEQACKYDRPHRL